VNTIVLASDNRGKLRELSQLMAPMGFDLTPQGVLGIETPPETGTTFEANALLKARFAAEHSGLPALADDSGIEVDALDGRPGVFSARYAGEGASDDENLRKLLNELQGVPPERRTARYQCVIVLVQNGRDEDPLIARGTWEGRIGFAPHGTGGFGYDPIFIPCGSSCTSAEMSAEQKNTVSHRGQALRELVALVGQRAARSGPRSA
jgi:XTP/dITP diphosphohydrolase